MQIDGIILVFEALLVYLLVLGTHAMRRHSGLVPFYALLGCITAIMSWVTDAGICVQIGAFSFMVGSAVFYTSLLLGVFVVYVFDGPRATRIAISTVAGLSLLVPLIALTLRWQMHLANVPDLANVPTPSLRINGASVATTIADLIFLAIAWEFLGKPKWGLHLWLRAFLTLLGVMWLDVLLFATGAFAGTPLYFKIMGGTFSSRLIISLIAAPILYAYLLWQRSCQGYEIPNRPVLAVLKEIADIRVELTLAQQEIEHRKKVEAEKAAVIAQLESTLLRVQRLEGILPVCASCRKIRVEPTATCEGPRWLPLETYLYEESNIQISHGICPECEARLYAADNHAPVDDEI